MGAVVCPRKALKAPTECCAKRSVEPHPLTTIDLALRFKGTSLRNTQQRSWDVHRGPSHACEGLLVVCGSAEVLLPAAGATCALRVEPELGDWSYWKLWRDKNDFLRHHQGDQKFSFERENTAQIRQVTHTIWRRTFLFYTHVFHTD